MKRGKKILTLLVGVLLLVVGSMSFSSCSSSYKNSAKSSSELAKDGKNVYFAAPMFMQAEKDYNLKITNILEEYGYHVFLPQRDGIEGALLEGKTEQELVDIIFPLDVQNVNNCDILFMNLDGRVPDEGACVELGLAYAQGKRCYGFKTDTRTIEFSMELNPMITGCMIKIFKNYDGDEMIKELKEYLSNNSL